MSQVSPEFLALQAAVAGRYSLDRELGRGGMGVVFLARDVALDRPVAIKLLPPSLAHSRAARARFLREARAAARLSHPHVVPVHSVEEHGELACFVMRYVDGETLGQRVHRAGPLTLGELARVVQQVAGALGHAHAHGVIHRDVKPDNILLEAEGGAALVADFGIAEVHGAGEAGSGAGAHAGTPHYMSPELSAGAPADARSDLYALGVTAFFAATGRLPFEGRTAAAVMLQHATAAAPPLRTIRPSLPSQLADAIDRCLRRDPEERWTSAEQLARTLGELIVPEPPAPIRAFVRETAEAGAEIGTALTAAGVAGGVLAVHLALDTSLFGFILIGVYGSAAALGLGLAGVRVGQLLERARALALRGYDHAAVLPALQHGMRERQAERDAERASSRAGTARTPARERWMLTGIAALKTGAGVWLVNADVPMALAIVGLAISIAIPTVTLRLHWREHDWPGRLWHRIVTGTIGKLGFRIARLGLGAVATPSYAGGTPTEALIGRAAGELFAGLPPAEQAQFEEVPRILQRLEQEAATLRARGDDPAARERLAATVAALETLRLDLLKLHAGRAAAGDLTRDLDAARAIGARVDEAVEAVMPAADSGRARTPA